MKDSAPRRRRVAGAGAILAALALAVVGALLLAEASRTPSKELSKPNAPASTESRSARAPRSRNEWSKKPTPSETTTEPQPTTPAAATAPKQASLRLETPRPTSDTSTSRKFRSAASTAKSLIATGNPALFDELPQASGFGVYMTDGRFVLESVEGHPHITSVHWVGRGVGSVSEGDSFDPSVEQAEAFGAVRPLVVYDDGAMTRVAYGDIIELVH